MKTLLLSFAAACVVTAASAAVDFTSVWNVSKTNVETATFNAPVAFDSKGNVVTVAPADLGANLLVLSKENGSEVLKCGIDGAVTVTSVAVDASDNVYIAGTLADGVVFAGKENSSVTLNGMKIDGAATIEQNASFIVKYSADGKAVKGITFCPVTRPEYALAMDPAAPGSVYFHINHLKVSGNNVYASAVYTGTTTPAAGIFKAETIFESNYASGWEGLYIKELKAGTIFSLDNELSNGTVVADAKVAKPIEFDPMEPDVYELFSVSFGVKAETVYAGFVGYGDLTISAAGKDTKFNSDATNRDVTFLYATFTSTGLDKVLGSTAFPDASKEATNLINTVLVDDANTVFGMGNLHTEEGEPASKVAYLVVNKVAEGVEITTVKQTLSVSADTESAEVSSAAFLPSGEIAISALNFYNMAAESEKKGKFAGTSNAYIFDGKDFVKAADFVNPISFVSKGENFAASAVVEGGVAYTLYTAKTAGIADIVADENAAEAEYFNLQGVRVANPENGLYIVRRGNTVTKQLLRK
ncbi:MAG: hypothetical protein K2K00_00465 [Muribaculaceae bacterium]|nr:hypothetical protein [Muribaculaceae bacterium]